MKEMFLTLYLKVQALIAKEDGQDLVEYALIVALIALACCAGMNSLATAINNGFSTLGTTLTSDL
jgi:pilus assembly protein Flp/PilA